MKRSLIKPEDKDIDDIAKELELSDLILEWRIKPQSF